TVRGMRSDDNTASITGITSTYYAQNGWRSLGSTTSGNGIVTIDLFPGNYDFRATLNSTADTLNNVTVNGDGATANVETNVDFYPTQLTLLALNSDSVGVQNVTNAFKATPTSSWTNIGNSNTN